MRKLVFAAAALAALVLAPAGPAWAAGGTRPPPDVRIDPDRGMTFERIPRTNIDGAIYQPFRESMRWRFMRPEIEPYNSVIDESGVYDPATGKIRGMLSDKVNEMRRRDRR